MSMVLPVLLAASQPSLSGVLLRTVADPRTHYKLRNSETSPRFFPFMLCEEHYLGEHPVMQRHYELCTTADCPTPRPQDFCDRCPQPDYWAEDIAAR